MKITEAIILAGGLGTRLRDTVPDLPKCMAPVAGRPFLFHVINYLRSQGLERFIFSLGYKHAVIEDYLSSQFSTLNYECVIEEEPLGTGGAIRLACTKASKENIVVANGDTLFKADIKKSASIHYQHNANCTMALKPLHAFDRYGAVELNGDHSIKSFKEKQFYENGLINGGIYLLNTAAFLREQFPPVFSFETDWLANLYDQRKIYGVVQDEYFIDIGIPEDYERAQEELKQPPLVLSDTDKRWTLFIDRDGVINHEKKDGYILNRQEFRFYDGVKEAFRQFNERFGWIIIVSNQRGVGNGLMTEADLEDLHYYMTGEIEKAGGRIDRIYYCISTDNKNPDRKPNPGMAFLAKKDFPSIDLSKSIMLGNKPSDMQFGRNAGTYCVFVKTTNPEQAFPDPDIDQVVGSLADFVKAL